MTTALSQLAAASPSQRGRLLGLATAMTYFSVFVGALAFRPVYDVAGMAGCALASLGVTLLACVIALVDVSALQNRRQSS
jgi:predicted MFS family arabinose efflux permease